MKPKICVPLTGKNIYEIKNEAGLALLVKPDIIEFRADFFNDVLLASQVSAVIKENTCGIPIIFTLRLDKEGGAVCLAQETRAKIMKEAIESSNIDYIDIEKINGEGFTSPLINAAHRNNIKVIISSHNFKCTPPHAEIINTLKESQNLGADLVKVAVMPESEADVFVLLRAVLEYKSLEKSVPLIAISMGETGKISRAGAGLFGSVITFASLTTPTAPGQVHIGELKRAVEMIY